jgi:hypothetical protein
MPNASCLHKKERGWRQVPGNTKAEARSARTPDVRGNEQLIYQRRKVESNNCQRRGSPRHSRRTWHENRSQNRRPHFAFSSKAERSERPQRRQLPLFGRRSERTSATQMRLLVNNETSFFFTAQLHHAVQIETLFCDPFRPLPRAEWQFLTPVVGIKKPNPMVGPSHQKLGCRRHRQNAPLDDIQCYETRWIR